VTALVAALVAVPLALGGCSAVPPHEPKYGSLPGFLPKDAVHADRMLVGSALHPALTTEGDPVDVQLSTGSVVVTVTGPDVPGNGLPYQTKATTCTWTITLSGATAPVRIRTSDFTSIDHLGAVYAPKAVTSRRPAPPSVLRPNQTVTFELRAVMMVGEGLMRWSPDNNHTVASWDFEVEND
jgi:hypothetical protein